MPNHCINLNVWIPTKKITTQLFGSQLRRNMSSGMGTMAIDMVIQLAMYPIYLHFLGYEKYGVWLMLAVVLSFVQMGGNFGIEQAATKLVAEEYGKKNIPGVQSYIAMALMILLLSGLIGFIILFCLKTQIIALFKLDNENSQIALRLLPYMGLLCIYVFIIKAMNGALAGLGRLDITNYIRSCSRLIVLVVATLLLCNGMGIESLPISYTVSYIMTHLACLFFIRKIVKIRVLSLKNWDYKRFKNLFQFGGKIFGSSLLELLISPFNKIMLSRYAGVATVPVYEIAFTGARVMRGPIEVAVRAIMPEISHLSGVATLKAKKQINNIVHRSTKLIILMGLPISVLLLLAEPLLKIWLGERFLETIPTAFRIMLIGTFINLLCAPSYHALTGLGKVHYRVISTVIITSGDICAILTIFLLTGFVSVNTIGLGLIISYTAGTCYLIIKRRQVVNQMLSPVKANL